MNPVEDVWPGDVLAITSGGVTTNFLVRTVEVKDGATSPEALRYAIRFANDWATEYADGLGLKLSEAIAADVDLPSAAADGPGSVLPNLQQMEVTTVTATAITVDAGIVAPMDGGFEVRRADWQFGAASDPADLVLRSPVPIFTIPRASQVERFYVRTYDASSPAQYSRFSSAVFVDWPVG